MVEFTKLYGNTYGPKEIGFDDCKDYCAEHDDCNECIIQKCFDLLRAYHDTGLTPDGIRAMDAAYLAKCKEVNALKAGQEWIPVSERMPNKPGYYWTTVRHADGSATVERSYWELNPLCEREWKEVVVAWHPYYAPEPYKPKTK